MRNYVMPDGLLFSMMRDGLQKISVICDRYPPFPRVVAKRQVPANFAR